MNKIIYKISLVVLVFGLYSCGQAPSAEEQCPANAPSCSEADINAPVPNTDPGSVDDREPASDPSPAVPDSSFRMPAYSSSWGLKQSVYESAVDYFNAHNGAIPNQRYAVVVDFSQHSSKKRFYLFDLSSGAVSRYHTAHGSNSDPDNDGYATLFSNVPDSRKSSLGAYLTLATYSGAHGYSLRLKGLESTNSNAEARAIVVHPADYVSEADDHAGRSWGCPALDPSVSKSIIDKIKGGALLYIGH
jgi:hypothetical protein